MIHIFCDDDVKGARPLMTTKPKKEAGRPKYSAPALEKGLDILELLAGEEFGLTLSGIATRLNRSVSELFRMLIVLEGRGYVYMPQDSDKYLATLKLFELAHSFRPVQRLTSVSGPIMKNLAHRIEQSCHLVIYYEGKGHVVAQQDSPSERVLSVRLGAEAPLLDSCSGHLILTYAEEQERALMVAHIPKHHRRPGRTDLDSITRRVRKQGFELIDSAQISGVRDIGYPVFDHTNHLIAALVVPFFSFLDGSHPVDIAAAQGLVMTAAAAISREMGYSPES
jgi:DNA-binding IclR family transcriptional regulator